mgnify:CR=1 FL=1
MILYFLYRNQLAFLLWIWSRASKRNQRVWNLNSLWYNNKNTNTKSLTQTNKKIKKHIDETQKFAEVRHIDNKTWFYITDGKETIFMIHDYNEVRPTYDIGVWFDLSFAKDLFEKFSK